MNRTAGLRASVIQGSAILCFAANETGILPAAFRRLSRLEIKPVLKHRKSPETLTLQGFPCGRGRRIRTLNKGFGDPRVTITPFPYTTDVIIAQIGKNVNPLFDVFDFSFWRSPGKAGHASFVRKTKSARAKNAENVKEPKFTENS